MKPSILPQGVYALASQTKGSPQVIGVARNFIDHCKELNNAIPTRPNFFFKSPSSIIFPPDNIKIPSPEEICSVHYEAEVAVLIGKRAKDVSIKDVPEHIAGITVALDITARDVQEFEKSKQLPWTLSKSLSTFCPLCPDLLEIKDPERLNNIRIKALKNGMIKQDGNTQDMIFKIPELISYLSSLMILERGDIILTGTPAGVGPIEIGDTLNISISTPDGLTVNAQFMVEQKEPRSEGVAFYPFIQK